MELFSCLFQSSSSNGFNNKGASVGRSFFENPLSRRIYILMWANRDKTLGAKTGTLLTVNPSRMGNKTVSTLGSFINKLL
jgi:hypothetical protein